MAPREARAGHLFQPRPRFRRATVPREARCQGPGRPATRSAKPTPKAPLTGRRGTVSCAARWRLSTVEPGHKTLGEVDILPFPRLHREDVGKGLPDQMICDPHNFHFTTEVHTKFIYRGGETFNFEGDDDLWVFVNNKLALDLGGLHPSVTGSIVMDSLGLTMGTEYPLDLFHAERGMCSSHFRIDTTLQFSDCGTIVK